MIDWRGAARIFALLLCLYVLTGGGQGYSVDGTFSYQAARSLATDPSATFLRQNADTLRRWGVLMPLAGAPLTWLGARLAAAAPPRDSVVVAGQRLALHEWQPIGAGGTSAADGTANALVVPVAPGSRVIAPARVRLVSFLSLGSAVRDGAVVARVTLGEGATERRADIIAGRDTAEWSYDVAGTSQPGHTRARLAGHWPGNPQANLYWADLQLDGAGTGGMPGTVRIEYLAPAGRLHVRAVALLGDGASVQLPGPPSGWSAEDQAGFFTRFTFSFLNAPAMAALCALLAPLGVVLGYRPATAATLALGVGTATLLWPYARYDFAEPLAALCMVAAALLVYWAAPQDGRTGHWWWGKLAAAGACAALAAAAKYSAVWFLPLLAVQVTLLWATAGQRGRFVVIGQLSAGVAAVVAVLVVPLMGLAGMVAATGRVPTIWTGWSSGLVSGWLDFPLWAGVYGLLLSPGKGLFLYAPLLVLALLGATAFVRRHRGGAFLFLAVPVTYALFYGSKGVWHGGGWGPRYLVPAVPFLACLALPVVERLLRGRNAASEWFAAGTAVVLVALSVGVQVLGVAKHPNQYTVMFRDHVAPQLADYGKAYGGPAAEAYWRHFGGPEAYRQLDRPPGTADGATPQRGLGYLFAEDGPLELRLGLRSAAPFDLTLYMCDWDHRGRRQRVTVDTGAAVVTHTQDYDISGCEYLTWRLSDTPGLLIPMRGDSIRIRVEATATDTPVLSGLFFDPPRRRGPGASLLPVQRRVVTPHERWTDLYGTDGYALLAWLRGADVAKLPPYVAGIEGGDRVWVDTWQNELAETPLLYAPGFSPLAAHGWLLTADALATLTPGSDGLLRRALGSPPWRYTHGLDVHPDHPEYALGLDFWPLLLRAHFRSHGGFMTGVWLTVGVLAVGMVASAWALARSLRETSRVT